ncbi:MAG: hypothetical protein JW874_07645 [Spirochaetales bacterium]|nr:hypothetical protein [Spirochaetales bacterium]
MKLFRRKYSIPVLLLFLPAAAMLVLHSCDDFSFYPLMDEYELTLSPESIILFVNNQCAFSASGGVAPYEFSVQSGNGSIDSSTGQYTAGSAASEDTIRVTDSMGTWAEAEALVILRLLVTPSSVNLPAENSQVFTATGGNGTYTFSLVSGGGSLVDVDASSAEYTAPAVLGVTVIEVSDSYDNSAEAYITVTAPGEPVINPASAELGMNESIEFTASNGTEPYYFTLTSGGGSIIELTGSTVRYTAPDTPGNVILTLSDSALPVPKSIQAQISVTSSIPLQISPASITLAYNQEYTFSASGGTPPYEFAIESGGGSIEVTGPDTVLFTAPASNDQTILSVEDSLGISVSAKIKTKKP